MPEERCAWPPPGGLCPSWERHRCKVSEAASNVRRPVVVSHTRDVALIVRYDATLGVCVGCTWPPWIAGHCGEGRLAKAQHGLRVVVAPLTLLRDAPWCPLALVQLCPGVGVHLLLNPSAPLRRTRSLFLFYLRMACPCKVPSIPSNDLRRGDVQLCAVTNSTGHKLVRAELSGAFAWHPVRKWGAAATMNGYTRIVRAAVVDSGVCDMAGKSGYDRPRRAWHGMVVRNW
eukprot:CAMPEP_0115860854 /NCGR_PEP_ID=MMETSP0287-20121206/17346_1 /TAXON_ID=412157 /ORGANISM="Chrysochromulina rotalis, Strain UIO044" /LENGTH=229 /DNA_ID=CAMNT_0003315199 /DNA_START=220 /DNA_END=913 /DNA_ORIENTATION=-